MRFFHGRNEWTSEKILQIKKISSLTEVSTGSMRWIVAWKAVFWVCNSMDFNWFIWSLTAISRGAALVIFVKAYFFIENNVFVINGVHFCRLPSYVTILFLSLTSQRPFLSHPTLYQSLFVTSYVFVDSCSFSFSEASTLDILDIVYTTSQTSCSCFLEI